MKRRCTAVFVGLAIIAGAVSLSAQTHFASVTGTVTSSDGASVPKVKVVATNQDTQVTYNAVSNDEGLYTITALPIGTYVVTAQAQGADNTVFEAGLNPNGSNAAANSETSTGSFTISATDGIQNIVIGGTSFTLAQIQGFNGTQTVNTGEGVLTLTGYTGDAHSGTVAYSYTLSATIDNDSKVPTGNDSVDATGFNDSVALTVNGNGGTTASDNLVVRVVDDVPTAHNDGPYAVV